MVIGNIKIKSEIVAKSCKLIFDSGSEYIGVHINLMYKKIHKIIFFESKKHFMFYRKFSCLLINNNWNSLFIILYFAIFLYLLI